MKPYHCGRFRDSSGRIFYPPTRKKDQDWISFNKDYEAWLNTFFSNGIIYTRCACDPHNPCSHRKNNMMDNIKLKVEDLLCKTIGCTSPQQRFNLWPGYWVCHGFNIDLPEQTDKVFHKIGNGVCKTIGHESIFAYKFALSTKICVTVQLFINKHLCNDYHNWSDEE